MEQLTNFFRKTILPNFANYMKNGSSSVLDYDDGELISNEDNQTSPVDESEHFSAQLSITEQVSNLSNATIMYGNHTTVDDYWKEDMKFVLDCLLLLLLILIMLAMGCEITVKSVKIFKLGVSRQADYLTRTSAHVPQGPRLRVLSWAQ
ncbi:hypothetical protein TNCV_3890971 [Trichonephila clavipes]|nr:hypothetical protein TNCV_3890971 [Trichonephila clavipes]